jgi:polyketide cyclase/dehydrase/lipid transport protein
MLIIKHTVQTTAPAWAIWQIWSDVSNWPTWDHGIQSSSINGPFATGTMGKLEPKGGPEVIIKLTSVKPNESFIAESKLFGARIIVSHSLTESGNKTLITEQIEMQGPLAFFFAFIIGRNMKKNLPVDMLALVKKAEELSKAKVSL